MRRLYVLSKTNRRSVGQVFSLPAPTPAFWLLLTQRSSYEFCQTNPIPHFAKTERHERQELIPEDENVGSRQELSLSRSRKVILPNKANSSTS